MKVLKITIIVSIFHLGVLLNCCSGQFFFNASFASGYHMTAYSLDNITKQSGYIPFDIRLSGGYQSFMIGIDYRSNFVKPRFTFKDELTGDIKLTDYYKENYIGGHITLVPNIFDRYDDESGATFYLDVSLGCVFSERITILPDKTEYGRIKYNKPFYVSSAIGLNIFFIQNLYMNINYQFTYSNRKALDEFEEGFKAWNHGPSLGLNFIIGG